MQKRDAEGGVSKKQLAMSWPVHIRFARKLRKNQTKEESVVWQLLTQQKVLRHEISSRTSDHFQRNGWTKKGFYIADCYCSEEKLVLEIDREIHNYNIDYDKARDVMHELGLKVLRMKNEEANNDVNLALEKIKAHL